MKSEIESSLRHGERSQENGQCNCDYGNSPPPLAIVFVAFESGNYSTNFVFLLSNTNVMSCPENEWTENAKRDFPSKTCKMHEEFC